MNLNDVLNSPDFEKLVRFASCGKKYNLEFNDLVHEVRVSIFNNMHYRPVILSPSTIIVNHTHFVIKESHKQKWYEKHRAESSPTEHSYADRGQEICDARDEWDFLKRCPFVDQKDYGTLLKRFEGFTLAELGSRDKISPERVRQICEDRLAKIRNYYASGIKTLS
jgi:DNA-directed RNA polymerase specialized sigma24 family protein